MKTRNEVLIEASLCAMQAMIASRPNSVPANELANLAYEQGLAMVQKFNTNKLFDDEAAKLQMEAASKITTEAPPLKN